MANLFGLTRGSRERGHIPASGMSDIPESLSLDHGVSRKQKEKDKAYQSLPVETERKRRKKLEMSGESVANNLTSPALQTSSILNIGGPARDNSAR